RVAGLGQQGRGLRVSARGCDVAILQQLVDSYNERYPDGPRVQSGMADWRSQSDEVRAGQVDVTLTRLPCDERGLDSEPVQADPRLAVLPEAHRLAGREVIERGEVSGEAFPLFPNLTPAETAYWTGTD